MSKDHLIDVQHRSTTRCGAARLAGFLLVLITSLPLAVPAGSATPLFDAHIHYNRDVWERIPPDDAIARMDRAGIEKAFVSSTPTDGTEKLYALEPERIVPVLRPYRSYDDRGTWHSDPTLVARLEERLAQTPYRGIGEFHVFGEDASTPQMAELLRLSIENNLFLHAHADEEAILRLIRQAPELTVIWAHAGFDVPVERLETLLIEYPRLLIELSYRTDIAPDGQLATSWRRLFIAAPDRFLFGSDPHVGGRWVTLNELTSEARSWLDQLPPDVAKKIAYGNAARLAEASGPSR